MKKITFLLSMFMMLAIVSCSKDDESKPGDKIIGEWKLSLELVNGVVVYEDEEDCDTTVKFLSNGTYHSIYYFQNADGECELEGTEDENENTWEYLGDNMYETTYGNEFDGTVETDLIEIIFSGNNEFSILEEEDGATREAVYVRVN